MTRFRNRRAVLCASAAAAAIAALAAPPAAVAQEATYSFDIPAQDVGAALLAFGRASRQQLVFDGQAVRGKRSATLQGDYSTQEGLERLLEGTGLRAEYDGVGAVRIVSTQGPQGGGAAGSAVQALIVTAQKREEDIQDVPIAISAFSQEDLTRSQVAGGPDLMTQVPNMTFTKTNFSSYSIQLRGIGTQAISATTDPAVAVAFNNTPFVRNRFFEQEFYDLERVEVLRGPQGTLYGRNATAGVVNIISAKPTFRYEAKLSADVGNYHSARLEGMANFPIVEDKVALRLAGAWTTRQGYSTNEITGNPIDGRDLWSVRASLRFEPSDPISVNLIYEHFQEDDDRLRSGKQLCKKDPNKTQIAGVALPVESNPGQNSSQVGTYNQGCIAASLYSPESFQTPNGFALPYYQPLSQLVLPTVQGLDPYLRTTQSRDLRVIESTVDPVYHAKTDTAELQVRLDFGPNLTLDSETAYSVDTLSSLQDYNRFNTAPGAFDKTKLQRPGVDRPGVLVNGFFCDPQIGCADRLVAVDMSTADSRHFSQEFRLSSDYDGPFNFSLGANFLRYDTEDKYYVFINTLSMYAAMTQRLGNRYEADGPYVTSESDNSECLQRGYVYGNPNDVSGIQNCIYIDPNPIGSLNDMGHNYFLSRNPYRLISYAAFGEGYYNLTEALKVTGGLRWTVDKKHAPQIPSWLLAGGSVGYPVKDIVDVEWSEPTGRLAIDWKPDLPFTNETLLYGSYAHGYKAGGANPPPMTVVASQLAGLPGVVESVLHPTTFDAEFVNAFEAGAKNVLFDGRVTLNVNGFYYDYKGYQISQIIDRSAVNSNFDAEVWGLELEIDWRPTENLRFGFKGGYEDTKVADGSQAIDVMDRTGGRSDWVVAKPFPSLASNCILPTWLVTYGNYINTLAERGFIGGDAGFCAKAYIAGRDPVTFLPYEPNPTHFQLFVDDIGLAPQPLPSYWAGYPGFDPSTAPNNGEGFFKDLSGNELPNAPHYTATLTADYAMPLAGGWLANFHADLYWQSEAWARIFNMEGYDKLKAYTNINLAATFTNSEAGWKIMAYVKNVMDRDSITGAFLNSDDSGLTTNVFLTEPRLYGVRVTKEFSDVPLLGDLLRERDAHPASEPYAVTVEVGGGPRRLQSDTETLVPEWLNIYLPSTGFPLDGQNRNLDLGDGREFRLTYATGDWRVSAGVRYGRTSGKVFESRGEYAPEFCRISYDLYFNPVTICEATLYNWGSSLVRDSEEYRIADFLVGMDVGVGAWGEGSSSIVSLGLKYAELTAVSQVEQRSSPDHQIPSGVNGAKYQLHWHDYDAEFDAERTFKGVGPVISWEASSVLLGDADTGRVNLDWGLGGGVLFGRQKVNLTQETTVKTITGTLFNKQTAATVVPDGRQESKSAQVPTVAVNLGLSYSIDRLKLSGGYRWERYFDAIDGGVATHKDYDRTIDGPYLKLSVGFGG